MSSTSLHGRWLPDRSPVPVVVAFILALLAVPSQARASTDGAQHYLWANQEAAALDQPYVGPSNYSYGAPDYITRIGTGQYRIVVGAHDPFDPLQSQVVAYGTDNTRCKFQGRSFPVLCSPPGSGNTGWCTEVAVACTNAAGALVNSKFAYEFSGTTYSGPPTNPGPKIKPKGPAGFMETTSGGTAVAKNWKDNGNFTVSLGTVSDHFNSAGGAPTVTRLSTGQYRVDFPGLAVVSPLGLAQVTAVGGDAVHCKPTGSPGAASSGSSTLRININCYVGSTLANSDFVVNYDSYVTRWSTGYQGARAYADQSTVASYTPTRSYNSGGITGAPGVNVAHRTATGRYYMEHTTLGPLWSNAHVVAVGANSNYCKVESWAQLGSGTGVWLRCFNASGNAVDTPYLETYQGGVIGPF